MQKMIKQLITNRRRVNTFFWRLAITLLSTLTLQAYAQLIVTPSFGSATVPQNTNTTLSITFGTSVGMTDFTFLASAGPLTLTGANFVSAVPTVNTCPTSVTSVSANQISLVGLAGPGFGNSSISCTLTFDVTAVGAPGSTMSFPIAANSLTTTVTPFSSVPSPNVPGPANGATATATIQAPPPTMTVAVSPTRVAPNFNSTLTILISNPNPTALTINTIQIQPALDLRLTGVVDNCGTGAIITTVVFGPGSVDFLTANVAATLAPNTSCTITAQARSATPGTYVVPVAAGNLVTSAGSNVNTSSATLIVALPTAPPTVALAVVPANVGINTAVALTITYTNPDTVPSTITSSSINIPAGLTPGFGANTGTCGGSNGGSGNTIGISGITIPASGSCTHIISLQTPTVGTYTIPYAIGALTTSTGSNAAAASAVLVVAATPPPTVALAVTGSPAISGSAVTLTITYTNPAFVASAITSSSILVPAGLTVVNAGTTTCGGMLSAVGNSVTLLGATIPGSATTAGSCTQTIPLQTPTVGTFAIPYLAGALVTSTGSNAAAASVNVVVTAAPTPVVTFTPNPVTFAAQIVNTTSPLTSVAVGVVGAPLQITSIAVTGDFAAVSPACPISPAILAVAASCAINVTFTPLALVPPARVGTLTINAINPVAAYTVALGGTASAVPVPGIALNPGALNFAPQPTNTQTIQNVQVTNTGTANLTIGLISTTSADFRIVAPSVATFPICGATLAPAASCLIGVAYSSINGGTTTATLNVSNNATATPASAALTGTSVVPSIPLIALTSPINFGDQIVGTTSASVTPSIRNSGTAPLVVSGLSVTGANATDFVLSGGCTVVAVGASCNITLTFNPTATGIRNAQINVLSNASNAASTNTIALVGNGIPAPAPRADLNITAIAFGNTIFGGAAPSQTVTLTNGGTVPLAVQSLIASPEYVQMNNCPAALVPQATCSIMISFTPLGLGPRGGELVLTSNAVSSPDRIPLAGVGCRWFSPANSRLFSSLCGN
jgi:hypothetical protein